METKITELESIDIRQRIESLGLIQPSGWAFLPTNLESCDAQHSLEHADSVLALRKLMAAEGVAESPVEPEGLRIPRRALRYIDWIGPTIFFSAAMISENPTVVSVCLNVFSNYVFELFRGRSTEVRAHVKIVLETKRGSPAKVLEYDGPVAGLKDLPKVISSLHE